MKTLSLSKKNIRRQWYVIDAEGKRLGRLASRIALILKGKGKTDYTPNVDNGDFVVVINADKVVLTGKKMEQKMYFRHSGYPGGVKILPYQIYMRNKPEEAVFNAVKGMINVGPQRSRIMKRLKIYAKPDHPHTAQKPAELDK